MYGTKKAAGYIKRAMAQGQLNNAVGLGMAKTGSNRSSFVVNATDVPSVNMAFKLAKTASQLGVNAAYGFGKSKKK